MTDNPYGCGRLTPARRAIVDAVDRLGSAFSADDLAAVASDPRHGAAATATVYRAIAALEDAGYIERVGERDGAALWTRCAEHAHHHHIVCERCGRVAHTHCPIDDHLVREIGAEGFTVTRHEVTLYGLCPTCALGNGD